ncbi:Chitin synthase 8, partial [Dufourea novaeangliae]
WDAFKHFPLKGKNASMQNNKWINYFMCIVKLLMYGIIFCIVLCCGLIAKCTVLFAISQLDEEQSVQFCDYYEDIDEKLNAKISKEGRTIWTWYIIFMFLIPECFVFLQSIWYYIFKNKENTPGKRSIAVLLILETLHPIGLALLVFYCLPKINSVDAAAMSSCLFFIPVLINSLSQRQEYIPILCNFLALIAQGSGVIMHSFVHYDMHDTIIWILPVSLLLSSCRWWLNYVSHHSYCGFIRFLASVKEDLTNGRYLLQGCIALWRSLFFVLSAAVISIFNGIQFGEFFEFLWKSQYNVELVPVSNSTAFENQLETSYYFGDTVFQQEDIYAFTINTFSSLNTFIVHIFCTFLMYQIVIFAYKTQMHKFGVALPLSLITPGSIFLIIMLCNMKNKDSCAFHDIIPDFLYFKNPKYNNINDFIRERLASVEKIFYNSTFDSLVIDQFIGLNKRRYETYNIIEEEEFIASNTQFETSNLEEMERASSAHSVFSEENINNKKNACVTQIYACATMWHETKEEMMELIGSILRLDKDQCAMKATQDYYNISINDYYELETHIFFDDAFCCMHGCTGPCNHDENEIQINQYVATFLETMQESVENLGIHSLSPIKYPTPYGGQLIWNLPGKTRLTVHFKDKHKIRHRKRWSQVMYMYYLLGYRLMGSSMDIDRKEFIAENTYILTLDGDVDFQPTTVKVLVDLMKRDKELGGACGRIHPIGKGPIIWFQKFEYALGHWLQKSTEHITGSVLCSPGCFSLFRAKALMQHNVIAKYATKSTEPRHYIQRDQGEDRWLCTLLLQAGCRVEYCAAGDAYTHAPETFKDFYIQRRRWIPSTIANIFDLLNTSKETRKVNNAVSWMYIAYQWILTGSTIIGPSFIYLMMAGALVTCFQIDNWASFCYNLIPIVIFLVVCFFCEERIQLIVAEFITVIYALVMIIVLVGIILQVSKEGYLAPNTLLFFIVISQFVLTGVMHPQEISCLNNGIIYYITVPSMYMLLIIYSIFNVHNVTWGTRESKQQIKAQEQTNKLQSEDNQTSRNDWKKFSLINFFKYVFCTCNSEKEEEYLQSIYRSINEINVRLEKMERIGNTSNDSIEGRNNNETNMYDSETELQGIKNELYTDEYSATESSVRSSTTLCGGYSNYLVSPKWLQSEHIKNGKVDFLSTSEEEFWKQLIEKYLHPIDNDAEEQVQITKKYMHLEPIGGLFIVAFVVILFIQFLAMLVHRFNTFAHIIAHVKLSQLFNCKVSDDLITDNHVKNIVEGLQNAVEKETIYNTTNTTMPYSRTRKNIREIIEDNQNLPKMSTNFEVLFHRKLRESDTSGFSKVLSSNISKNAIEALENHRSKIIVEHKKRQSHRSMYSENDERSSFYEENKDKKVETHEYDNPEFVNKKEE